MNTAQKGRNDLKLASLRRDRELVTLAREVAFELVDGTLCCYVSGHKENAAELDTVRAASATVAKRLREESLETS